MRPLLLQCIFLFLDLDTYLGGSFHAFSTCNWKQLICCNMSWLGSPVGCQNLLFSGSCRHQSPVWVVKKNCWRKPVFWTDLDSGSWMLFRSQWKSELLLSAAQCAQGQRLHPYFVPRLLSNQWEGLANVAENQHCEIAIDGVNEVVDDGKLENDFSLPRWIAQLSLTGLESCQRRQAATYSNLEAESHLLH